MVRSGNRIFFPNSSRNIKRKGKRHGFYKLERPGFCGVFLNITQEKVENRKIVEARFICQWRF